MTSDASEPLPAKHGVDQPALDERLHAVLRAVIDRLIPTDDLGPGAGDAGVAVYIERALSSHHRPHLDAYVIGLRSIDQLARERSGAGFPELGPDAQEELLLAIEADGADGRSLREFFDLVLRHTHEGMFGDPSWGGNAGYAGWRLLEYPGPRLEWTAADQVLDVRVVPVYEKRSQA